jgi:hypothetical protein
MGEVAGRRVSGVAAGTRGRGRTCEVGAARCYAPRVPARVRPRRLSRCPPLSALLWAPGRC